ncbi:MAG: hypothetical protein K5Q00_06220, partial [Gammaproteobacteria bacterium]|nr:hypothetical protein [Gammaproteobacteria bacterium]
MYQLPTQALSIFQVIRQSFSLYHASFKKVLVWAILIAVLDAVFTLIMNAFHPETVEGAGMSALASLFATVIFFVIWLVLISALISSIYHVMHNRDSDMKAELAVGLRCWWRILLCAWLVSFIFVIVGLAVYAMMRTPTPSTAIVMVMALVSVVVILALFYFGVKFFAWAFLIITEGYGFFGAFKESFIRVKRSWWFTFGFLIVTAFIQMIATCIALGLGKGWTAMTGDMLWAKIVGEFVVSGLLTLIMSWMYSAQLT